MTSTSAPASDLLSEVSSQLGFSLIEMAVSLVVLTLVIGSILMPLATQSEQRQVKETQRALNEINEALVGYALAQTPPHLPCPDKTGSGGIGTANDGIEDFDPTTGFCVAQDGNIPWVTLGVASADPWGNRFRYLVTAEFSNRQPATPRMSLSSNGNLRVCTVNTCTAGTVVASGLPAIVLSHGKNGLGAINSNTSISNPIPATLDELENTPLGLSASDIVSRVQSQTGSTAGDFDDIVIWLSPNILFNRMVTASKLP